MDANLALPLDVIEGIGPKMAAALRTAGIDSFTKLSTTADDNLRKAVEAAGMRLAPSLNTWRDQAAFLARGDRAGFEAMKKTLSGGRRKGEAGD
jgi:predicted flap endonuclease-1-like 5' DNA nuclease